MSVAGPTARFLKGFACYRLSPPLKTATLRQGAAVSCPLIHARRRATSYDREACRDSTLVELLSTHALETTATPLIFRNHRFVLPLNLQSDSKSSSLGLFLFCRIYASDHCISLPGPERELRVAGEAPCLQYAKQHRYDRVWRELAPHQSVVVDGGKE